MHSRSIPFRKGSVSAFGPALRSLLGERADFPIRGRAPALHPSAEYAPDHKFRAAGSTGRIHQTPALHGPRPVQDQNGQAHRGRGHPHRRTTCFSPARMANSSSAAIKPATSRWKWCDRNSELERRSTGVSSIFGKGIPGSPSRQISKSSSNENKLHSEFMKSDDRSCNWPCAKARAGCIPAIGASIALDQSIFFHRHSGVVSPICLRIRILRNVCTITLVRNSAN